MTNLYNNEIFKSQPIDLLCGGTPCQDFSTAGLRAGLSGNRGTLTHEFIRLLATKRPKWFIWENVPGVFSLNKGQDFAAILGGFTGWNISVPAKGWGNAGIIPGITGAYSIAWRVLDAQYFGVPQRRRRVFVVGYSGNWQYPAQVLFNTKSLQWNTQTSRTKREKTSRIIAPCLSSSGKGIRQQDVENGEIIYGVDFAQITSPTNRSTVKPISPTLAAGSKMGTFKPNIVMSSGQANAEIITDTSPTLNCLHEAPIVFQSRFARNDRGGPSKVSYPLTANAGLTGKGDSANAVIKGHPRRFTPKEYERLQGFPDDYTNTPGAADGPRYKALGNSMAVPVMKWIGEQIQRVNNTIQ
jgi:DNA (cytosine-5)-methyltransferase 1